jgi:YbbR domain-containing protein
MRDFFLNDLRWKLFSLLLALAIWGTVHRVLNSSGFTDASTDRKVTYNDQPVFIVASSSDVHLYRVVPETVRVTVTGSDAAIAVLQANQIRATVNLTGIGADKELKRNVDISVPTGITVISVDPQKVGVIAPPPTH